MTGAVEVQLAAMGLALPDAVPPRAMFRPWARTGDLLFLAGQICEWNGEPRHFGPMSDAVPMEVAQAAARMCALNLLFAIRDAAGSLDALDQVVRLGGFVSAPPGYADGPKVVDGASALFVGLYGERGAHARTAVCVSSLPANALVEVDAVVALQ